MRQRCTGILLVLFAVAACSKAPTAPSGQLTLTARNLTAATLFVQLINTKSQQEPVLGQVGPSGTSCFILPTYADSSYLSVYDGLGTSGTTAPFIPALSSSWQLQIATSSAPQTLTALVSAGVSCTP